MSESFRKHPEVFILLGLIALFLLSAGVAAWLDRRFSTRPLFPFESRPVVPWGAASILGVIAIYVVLSVLFLSTTKADVPMPLRRSLIRLIGMNVSLFGLAVLMLHLSSGARLADLGMTARDWKRNILRGFVGCSLTLPWVYAVNFLAQMIWKPLDHAVVKAFAEDRSWRTALIATIGAVVAAPVTEELLFRAILLATLWKVGSPGPADEPEVGRLRDPHLWNPSGDVLANAAISLLFAFLHADVWPAPVPLFVFSMAMGELYRRSGSLIAVVVMHCSFNALSMAALLIRSSLGPIVPQG